MECVVCSWTIILPDLGKLAQPSQKIINETTDDYMSILLVQIARATANL